LAKSLFSTVERVVNPFGTEEILPAHSAACALLGATLLVYINPEGRDTYGQAAVQPCRYRLYGRDGSEQIAESQYLERKIAEALRAGRFRRIDVVLGQ